MVTYDTYVLRDSPDLFAAREALRDATRPIIEALGAHASLDGAVYFAHDNAHDDTATTIEVANRHVVDDNRFAFQKQNVSGRRVDISATTLKPNFDEGAQQYAKSRMNPDQHTVYGAPIGDNTVDGVLQLAFSEQYGPLPDENEIIHAINTHRKNLDDVAARYKTIGSQYDSMGDALLLDVPITPNAYMVEWDLSGSTKSNYQSYPLLRQYLTHAAQAYRDIFETVGGKRVQSNGDGETFRIDLPYDDIDRNNLRDIGIFGNAVVKSTVLSILAAHETIAEKYDGAIGPIRVVAELGRFEHTNMGESGPSMWDLADITKRTERGHSAMAFGSRALAAFDAAQ